MIATDEIILYTQSANTKIHDKKVRQSADCARDTRHATVIPMLQGGQLVAWQDLASSVSGHNVLYHTIETTDLAFTEVTVWPIAVFSFT